MVGDDHPPEAQGRGQALGGRAHVENVLGVEGLTAAQFLAVMPVVAAAVASQLVLAWGLLTGRPWSRPLGAFLWLGLGLLLTGVRVLDGSGFPLTLFPLVMGATMSSVAYAYLYGPGRGSTIDGRRGPPRDGAQSPPPAFAGVRVVTETAGDREVARAMLRRDELDVQQIVLMDLHGEPDAARAG